MPSTAASRTSCGTRCPHANTARSRLRTRTSCAGASREDLLADEVLGLRSCRSSRCHGYVSAICSTVHCDIKHCYTKFVRVFPLLCPEQGRLGSPSRPVPLVARRKANRPSSLSGARPAWLDARSSRPALPTLLSRRAPEREL